MVHRDLAARNVLVGANKVCKVSDFGLTRKVGSEQVYMSKKSRKLPIKWMSVEAIFNQEFTTYSDVYVTAIFKLPNNLTLSPFSKIRFFTVVNSNF